MRDGHMTAPKDKPTLRELIAKTVADYCTCHDDYKLRNRYDPSCGCDHWPDAIESVAKAERVRFAEVALGHILDHVCGHGAPQSGHQVIEIYAAAIAAAEAET